MRCTTPLVFAEQLSALRAASEFDTLRDALPSLCHSLGHCHFRYRGHFPLPGGRVATPQFGNWPHAWEARYEARRYASIDPALSHASRQLTPVAWTPALYVSTDAQQLLREQRAAGLRCGITYPVFTPSGASGTLSLSSSREPGSRLRVAGAHAWTSHVGALLAMHVHEAVWRIVQRSAAHGGAPTLTPRERECLQWVARGKTSWEIGRILALSEHGVIFHLRSVMRKLDVSSRHRAAQLANDYGLLDDGEPPMSTPLTSATSIASATSVRRDPRASCTASG
ncbi:LuxR family transcriptional regulator [Pandoraea pnomenusa]|uniref:helix-turn-helix transcriptional regulator n=1 Tax=Pandoraea pnomenusa TaxID=93220 RepID=UPI003341064C